MAPSSPIEYSATAWRIATAVLLTAFCLWIRLPRKKARAPKLFGGRSPRLQELLGQMRILKEEPLPPAFLSGPILQLLVFTVQQLFQEYSASKRYSFTDEELEVDLPDISSNPPKADDGSGRRVKGTKDKIVLSWLKPLLPVPDDAPVILIAPGLNCNKESLPGTSVYDLLLKRPCRVVTFHKRAMGGPLSAPVFHLFGHPSDFQAALVHVGRTYPKAPIHVVAYSSGNGLTGSHAALHGESAHPNLRSYCLLVGGADYNLAFAPGKFNFSGRLLFDYGLLYFTKQRVLFRNEAVLSAADPLGFQKAANCQTMQDLYDLCMKHFSGYPAEHAAEAEARINPFGTTKGGIGILKPLQVPLLWVLTEDDPVMPGGPPAPWMKELESLDYASLALFQKGSHCACYTSWRLERYVDQVLDQWLDAHERAPAPDPCK